MSDYASQSRETIANSIVIFCIDDATKYRLFESHVNATKPEGCENAFARARGRYNHGLLERTYIMHGDVFLHVMDAQSLTVEAGWSFMDDQESILLVTKCNKQYATLFFNPVLDRPNLALGSLCEVPEDEALASGSYTYREDIDCYFVCKHENPDRVPQEQDIPEPSQDDAEAWLELAVEEFMNAVMHEVINDFQISDVQEAAIQALAFEHFRKLP